MRRTQHPPLTGHSHPPQPLRLPAPQRTTASRPIGAHSLRTDAGRNSAGPPRASVPPGYRTVSAVLVPRRWFWGRRRCG